MSKEKSLVTGGTGFLGSHLVERLVAQRKEVRVLVRPGAMKRIKINNLQLLKTLGVEIVYGNLWDKDSLRKGTEGVDTVFHLAAISRLMNIPKYVYFDVNEFGTKNLLEACLKNNITKFIHMSTVSVLGFSPDGSPLKEEDFNTPVDLYGLSKLKAEEIVIDFYKKYNFPVIIIRPSVVYGPRCLDRRLTMFRLIKKRLFPIFGSGKTHIEFCYVDNLIDAVSLVEANVESIGKIYNITDGVSYEIEEIVNVIAEEVGAGYPWLRIPAWMGKIIGLSSELLGRVFNFNPFFSKAIADWMSKDAAVYDCSKAKLELKYNPSVDLREGIRRTVKWYRENGFLS